jgi:hypothetical protein
MLVVYDGSAGKVIRPVPFISITQNPIRNKAGNLGSYYDIVLTGTILSDLGSPNGTNGTGGFASSSADLSSENIAIGQAMRNIVSKQNKLRELFSQDGRKCELLSADGSSQPVITFYPTVQSITFDEGVYINNAKYTITLRAEALINSSNKLVKDSIPNSTFIGDLKGSTPSRSTADVDLKSAVSSSGFVEDYSETWSIEPQEGRGITDTATIAPTTFDANTHVKSIRSYILTRNITATGRTMYYEESPAAGGGGATKRKEAWEQARTYVYKCILKDTDDISTNNSTGYEQYPEYGLGPYFGSGYLNIAKDNWGGYNHVRTESFDVAGGTFTLQDTWLLSSGTAYEDYKMSLSRSRDGTNVYTINIDGTIKGLSSQQAGGAAYGGNNTAPTINGSVAGINTPYQNAMYKWHSVSNSGIFGPNCNLYRRAQAGVFATLNHVPASVAVSSNEFTGEITYNVEYDTRPLPAVSGTLSESITCTDTYPGDVFALIPVIGRPTGPVLQYLNMRTEYQRNLSIDLVFDRYYASGQGGNIGAKQFFLLSKPSLNQPFRDQIKFIINAFSPSGETGILKYFVSPPQETWDAGTGRYSLNINWTYELNR